jgi:hypothetical protein
MRSAAFILPFVASAAAAAVNTGNPTAVEGGLPLPLGEIGWEGVVTPGGPSVKVWGASFEVIIGTKEEVELEPNIFCLGHRGQDPRGLSRVFDLRRGRANWSRDLTCSRSRRSCCPRKGS